MAPRALDALGAHAALVEAAVRGAVLGGASRRVAAAVAAAAIRSVRVELPAGSVARAPDAAAGVEATPVVEATPDAKKKKRKKRGRRRRKPCEDGGAVPMALVPLYPASADVFDISDLGDEWADDLPPQRASAKRGRLEHAGGGAAALALPAAEPALVAGCLAVVHGLDSRADLNETQVLLLEYDAPSLRWRCETLGSETVRIRADKLRFHQPPVGAG